MTQQDPGAPAADALQPFVLLLFADESEWDDTDPAAWEREMAAHEAFGAHVEASGGQVVGGEALRQQATARTVRGATVTDGPFVELTEALGGYYVVRARDLEHAAAIAAHCPVGSGAVEVRPVMPTR